MQLFQLFFVSSGRVAALLTVREGSLGIKEDGALCTKRVCLCTPGEDICLQPIARNHFPPKKTTSSI